MSNNIEAEKGATTPSVVAGLGYPNGRIETSASPTGWLASGLTPDGAADLSNANVHIVETPLREQKG